MVGAVAGALAVAALVAALGFFLWRRRSAKKKIADLPAPALDGGDNLEDGRGEQHQRRQQDISSAAGGSNGTIRGLPPSTGQNSAPPPPPPCAHDDDDTQPRAALLQPAARQQCAADVTKAPTSEDGGKPAESCLPKSPAGARQQNPGAEGKAATRGCDDNKATGAGGGRGAAAEEDGGDRSAATMQSLTATNSTADMLTEERAADLAGLEFPVEDGADDDDAPSAADGLPAATAGGRGGRTSTGFGYGRAVLTAAQELAQHCQIPGVSEAATMVSILINLVSDSRDCTSRGDAGVKRCRSIVMILKRAAKVLGKVSDMT